jgi:hypothetical protein
MSQKVRWEDVDVRIYVNGTEHGPFACTSFQSDSQMNVDRAKYQGRSTQSLDSTYEGERGSMDFNLDDDYGNPADVYQPFKDGVIDRTGRGKIRIVATERVQGGSSRRGMRYDDCQISYSESKGEGQVNKATLTFEAERGEVLT